ncbi:MAG: serine/threonine protein kinase, partial [Myxococcales bacterium]|nr:serine/threonine protein kinase [Myxococcales bacterium]
MATSADQRRGELVAGRYRIMDVLGRGGSAETFRVEDVETGQQLALKELLLGKAADWKVVELFEREATVLAGLSHTAIPRYVDHKQVDGPAGPSFYLVQELAPGRPLTQWLEQGWRADEAAVKEIAEQVLVVLGYLHSLQPPVIHRDLKPQNLIRADDGTIRLVDFGAVQAAIRDPQIGGSTLVGTYGFMAPEQSRGLASPATDFFGLGATLLYLLTRRTIADFPQKNLHVDFRKSVPISPAFAAWLEQMLDPDPAKRFQAAASARRALVTGATSSRRRRVSPWVLATAGAAALAVGAVALRPMLQREGTGNAAAAPTSTASDPELAQIQWLTAIPAHFSAVFSVDVSPDGETIASGSHDGTVKLWNARTGAAIAALAGHAGTVGAVLFAPDGKTLYTADASSVQVWDVSSHQQLRKLVGHPAQVSSVAVTPDGKRLASGGFDGTVRLWDAATGKALLVLTHGAGARVFSVSFSPDGSQLAGSGSDGLINIWNASDGTLLQTLKGHRGGVDRVAFAPDGQTVASVGDDRTLRVWSLRARREIYTRNVPRGEIWAMAISPDGQTIATGGQDGVIRLWSLMTGKVTRAFSDLSHSSGTLSLAFSRDGRLLVTGHGDNYVKSWPLNGGEHVAPTGVSATAGDEDSIERVGWQPLHLAAWDGNLPTLKKLIAEHANIDERNAYGRTPLYLAAKRGNLEAVKLLAASGANVDAPARVDMTPLWPAVQNGNVEVVRWLLDHGADPKHLTAIRQSPLYKAAEQGRAEIAKLILARSVPLNDRDTSEYTPLGIAVKNGHAEVVELLAGQRGIDLNCRNGRKSQLTPLQLAALDGHADIVKVLVAKGANVNDRGGAQWSALQAAQQHGYTSIV